MFKPISDFMVVELHRPSGSQIALPDKLELSPNNVYLVKAVGPGTVLDNGQLFTPDVKQGDKVLIAGKIVRFSVKGEDVLLGRAGDVMAVDRSSNAGVLESGKN